MPKCPFAIQRPITGGVGAYTSGPFKIVHHTTEGGTADAAFSAFKKNRSDPHFTVDETNIHQHIDTAIAARSLGNAKGGVETNRDSAVQIEVVGFAARAKSKATLRNVAKLCRWIEQVHGVPRVWPNGHPKTAVNGKDPGGHNRNAVNWDTKGGHYGHSQVPENTHWDPGYTDDEVKFLMEFEEVPAPAPGAEGLMAGLHADALGEPFDAIPETDPGLAALADQVSEMPHHGPTSA
jgi:N-acetylmuramoyl-L-alanine amidase